MKLANPAKSIDLKKYPAFVKEHVDRIAKIEAFLTAPMDPCPVRRMGRGCAYSQYRQAIIKMGNAVELFEKTKGKHKGKNLADITAEDCRIEEAKMFKGPE